jgi:hypothetical protein
VDTLCAGGAPELISLDLRGNELSEEAEQMLVRPVAQTRDGTSPDMDLGLHVDADCSIHSTLLGVESSRPTACTSAILGITPALCAWACLPQQNLLHQHTSSKVTRGQHARPCAQREAAALQRTHTSYKLPAPLTCMHLPGPGLSQEQLQRQRKQLKIETGALSAEGGALAQQEFKSNPIFRKYFQVGACCCAGQQNGLCC